MKIATLSFATALTLIFGLSISLSAQTTATWKGGAPGMEHEWNCPKNWSSYRVPDAFSDVIIPDVSSTTLAAPVIKNGVFEVNSIQVHPNAKLTVEQDAQLVVYNIDNDCLNRQGLCLKGSLLILNGGAESVFKNGVAEKQ